MEIATYFFWLPKPFLQNKPGIQVKSAVNKLLGGRILWIV